MDFGTYVVWRITRTTEKELVWVFLCQPRATWNEVACTCAGDAEMLVRVVVSVVSVSVSVSVSTVVWCGFCRRCGVACLMLSGGFSSMRWSGCGVAAV